MKQPVRLVTWLADGLKLARAIREDASIAESASHHVDVAGEFSVVPGHISSAVPATPATIPDRRRAAHTLVVEDNVVNQQLARRLIEKLGHQVDVATNGREAIAALGRGSYDLVLMDCQMPVPDGLEATREIRQGAYLTDQSLN